MVRCSKRTFFRQVNTQVNDTVPANPPAGHPCNGCGLCCALQLCRLALDLLGTTEVPCRALEFYDGRFWCGLVRDPSRYLGLPRFANRFIRPMVEDALGIGEACNSG